jgi:SAM-dependent methyltransferase
VLDIGCGDGLFFDALREFGQVEGVEPEASLLDPAGRWRSAIRAVPFDERFQPPHRFGLVLLLDVLEHLEDPAAALRQAVSLLAPGGVVLITVPAFQALWTRHDDLNHHRRRYSRSQFAALAREAGLRIGSSRYFFQWVAVAKLVARAVESVRSGPPALPTIPAEPVNRLLIAATRLETRVAAAVSLPFGSSLMVTGFAEAPGQDGRVA